MSLFFLIHITQVIRAGWNNFRAMVIGVEVVGDQEADSWNRRVNGKPSPDRDRESTRSTTTWSVESAPAHRGGGSPVGGVAALAGFGGLAMADHAKRGGRAALAAPPRAGVGRARGRGRSARVAALAGIRLARRRGCPGSTARSGSNRTSTRPPGGSRSSGRPASGLARSFTLDEIKALPRVEMTTELRCVEGWSEVVHWAGARLADLASATGLATRGGRPPTRAMPTACSITRRWRRPTATTTWGSTWPVPSIPRPCSATRWTASP